MFSGKSRHVSDSGDRGRFATTHWSMVLMAGRRGLPESRRALAALCEVYWFPLYAFVRRSGHSPHDAQDLTQEFFARLLENDQFAVADRRRGKFRSFLLGALKHFLSNERTRARAQKRGGRRGALSLDFPSAERRYQVEPADQLTPERLYEKRWALGLLEQVLKRLQEEMAATGKSAMFDELKEFLVGEKGSRTYREIAHGLAMTEAAVKVAVHRLRRRYREILEDEISQTLAGPDQVDDELRHLLAAVGSGRS